ncbi:MAG: V-type ATP synthase subunit D [Armatimonadota bacterium]|nr:V-type ATP synthase subunit D [Armatimonadota bacterium]MDR7485503.1 V-type ATP synthase subunit D [Armatimonadota bacterium]MDR7533048.1 V-type ATP synthase subunit D [Armatimonadota bacterium]MDR7536780.1 V-type ATP synthase subunit D [Armatimonadota bacterium]
MKRTRTALLAARAAHALAARGQEVLARKRDALLQEMLRSAREVLAARQDLAALAAEAVTALAAARGHEGPDGLRSAAAAATREVLVDVEVRNVWGVRVPTVHTAPVVRRPADRGYGLLGTSASVDDAAEAFERLVGVALEHAPREVRLRRLAAEIRRTGRKVNTLQYVLIPRLAREERTIAGALDEQEREDLFRLQLLGQEGLDPSTR